MSATGYVIMIGCPNEWTENQVQLLAERLCSDALPANLPVYYAAKETVDVPVTTAVVRA